MQRLMLIAVVLVTLAAVVGFALTSRHKAPQAALAQDPYSGIGLPQKRTVATEMPSKTQLVPAQQAP